MREWKPVITSARSCCRCSNRAPCSSCRGTRLRRAAQQPPGAVLRTRNAASYLGSCYRGINRIQNRVTPSIAVMSPHFADDVIALFVAAAEARGCVGLRSGPPRAVLRTRNAASYLGSCYRGINRIQNREIPSIAVMSPLFTNDVIALFVAAAEARGCVGLRCGPRGRSCGHATQPRTSAAATGELTGFRIGRYLQSPS